MKGHVIMALAQLKTYTEEDYYNLPEDVRAELINGQIYYMSAPSRIHQEILGFIFKKIAYYIDLKRGDCKVYPSPFAVKLFEDDNITIVEPDISVICDPDRLTDRGCCGAPDWIIEIISPSTSSHDYIRKLNLYADAGVKEYWIVDPNLRSIEVYHLFNGRYKIDEIYALFPDAFGITDREREESKKELPVSFYDDLNIPLEEIFQNLF